MNLRSPLTGELMPSKPPKKKKKGMIAICTPQTVRDV